MVDFSSDKKELSAMDRASLMLKNICSGNGLVKSNINNAALRFGITHDQAKRIWYKEARINADLFLKIQKKYETFIAAKVASIEEANCIEYAELGKDMKDIGKDAQIIKTDDFKALVKAVEKLSRQVEALKDE